MRLATCWSLLSICSTAFSWTAAATAQEAAKRAHFYKGVEVLCVGIDTHFSPAVPQLNQAVKDAKDFANVMESKYRFTPQLLLDKKATRKAVFAALDEMDARATPPEVAILYFACHGVSFEYLEANNPVPKRVGFLIPHDADVDSSDFSRPQRWAEEAIDMRQLVDRIDKMKCRHVVLIADACCSGFLTKRGMAESRELIAILSDPSRTILAATTQHESAKEGIFTKELVKILNDAAVDADPLSMTDVFRKLRASVPKNPQGVKMTPQMSHVGTGDGEFVFIPGLVKDKEIADLEDAVAGAKKNNKIDTSKLTAFQGIMDRQLKLKARQSRFTDVVAVMEAPDYRYAADAKAEATRWADARRTFLENAEMGDVWAMAGLHFCYAKGMGTEISPSDAYYWAQRADQFQKPAGVGKYLLGRCYRLGMGVPRNLVAADKLNQEAADAQFAPALFDRGKTIADKVKSGLVGLKPEDRVAGEKDLQAAFDAGMTSASVDLSKFTFYDPQATAVQIGKTIEMLDAAAKKSVPAASHALWAVYSNNRKNFPAKDLEKAKPYLLQAANLGDAFSQRVLAIEHYREAKEYYIPTSDLPQDFEKAFQWASAAAQQSDPGGHFLLAHMHRHGNGVALDHDKYRSYLDSSAQLKYAPAMNDQFWELCRGKLFKQDFDKAIQIAQQSAALGHADGHFNLGYYYLGILDPKTKRHLLKEGIVTFPFNENDNTYHTLHHYWQAYKISKHRGAKQFLESYWKTRKTAGGPLVIDDELKEHYPETAKELFASTDFEIKR